MSVIPLLSAFSLSVSLRVSQPQSVRLDREEYLRSQPDVTNDFVSLLPFCRRRICEYAFQHFYAQLRPNFVFRLGSFVLTIENLMFESRTRTNP